MMWSRDHKELLTKTVPHDVSPYFCGCVACEAWRAVRIVPGVIARPATQDPKKTSQGTVPAWKLGDWSRSGWDFRLERNSIERVLVIGPVEEKDRENAGHLDCVVILTFEEDPRLLVTSRKWLVLDV